MELLGTQPRDVYALCEFSRSDLKLLERAMNLVELDYDSSVAEEKEAADYFVKKFYPQVVKILETMEAEYGNAPDTEAE